MGDHLTVLKFRDEAIPSTGHPTPSLRVINGSERAMDIDFVERIGVVFGALQTEMGGRFSVQEEVIARRIASLTAELERIETLFIFRDIATREQLVMFENGIDRLAELIEKLKAMRARQPALAMSMEVHRNNGNGPKVPAR